MSDKTIEVVISPQEWWPVYVLDELSKEYIELDEKRRTVPVELLDRYKRFREEFEQLNAILRRIHTPDEGDSNG